MGQCRHVENRIPIRRRIRFYSLCSDGSVSTVTDADGNEVEVEVSIRSVAMGQCRRETTTLGALGVDLFLFAL